MYTELIGQFGKVLEVEYRGEMYRVRDNGSVYRKRRPNSRKRVLDEIWTFGTASACTGYMHISSVVVHRIVATAFHGKQPTDKHVVDHIDTNRRNNRVENLRWVTRLDNVLLNWITHRRIIHGYGSIDRFLKNPGSPIKPKRPNNFEWMRPVSKEEAQKFRDDVLRCSEIGQEPVVEDVLDVQSLTPNAIQRNWKTLSEFPMCPDNSSLAEYAGRLKFGTVFARNPFGPSLTMITGQKNGLLSVVCNLPENPIKKWSLAKVTIEDGKFVHEAIGTYFGFQGALKNHCKLLGIPFEELGIAESIDDYC